MRSVALEPESNSRDLLSNDERIPVRDHFFLGEPVVVKLTAEQAVDDQRMAGFLASRGNEQGFFLVRLACSFNHDEAEPIRRAWLTVALQSEDVSQGVRVIAMDPTVVEESSEVKKSVEGSVTLELAGASIGFAGKRGLEKAQVQLFIVAHGVGGDRVSWELHKTPTKQIGGPFWFDLIVHVQGAAPTTGVLEGLVEIQRHRFKFVPYKAVLPAAGFSTFRLSA